MFEKHITTDPTGDMYERSENGIFFRIYEVDNWRYIDPDKYIPFLEWDGELKEVDANPPASSDDQLWELIRKTRNELLSQSDWTQLPDVQLSQDDIIIWREYRQSLRDITTQRDPNNIVWPLGVE